MHSLDLMVTLASGLTVALAAGYVTHRLGLSPLVGYLFAGILVGPHTPGFVADQQLAEQLAEVGVTLLMFGIGLHFHLDDLLAVRRVAIPGAIVQSAVATALGALAVHAFGWSWTASVVFGIALSVASTVVLVRVLSDNNDLHTLTGHIAVGWLVVEDLLTVLVLVLMPLAVEGSGGVGAIASALALTLLKVGALVAIVSTIGRRVLPRLLNRIAATRSRELFTLAVLAIALGLAAGAATAFGVSTALGAFLAGLVVGQSDFSVRAASEALPMRDAFAVLFFVSVGMLLDPSYLLKEPVLVAVALLVVIVAKPVAALLLTRAFGYSQLVALRVAVALAQIGEFSFIVAALGNQIGVLGPDATNTIITVAIASITLNPALYRASAYAARWGTRRPSSRDVVQEAQDVRAEREGQFRAVVVGFGPVGRTVTRLLRANQIEPTIIELNMDTVRTLRQEGIRAVYGDARHPDTIKAAGVQTAQSVMLSAADMENAAEIVRLAREANPHVQIVARSASIREQAILRKVGADIVFSGEAEVALAFTEAVLRNLGATPEQIERERERVHEDLNTAVA